MTDRSRQKLVYHRLHGGSLTGKQRIQLLAIDLDDHLADLQIRHDVLPLRSCPEISLVVDRAIPRKNVHAPGALRVFEVLREEEVHERRHEHALLPSHRRDCSARRAACPAASWISSTS